MEKTAKGVAAIAGSTVVAGMMRKVENWNRRTTYEIAYGRMYGMLENPQFVEYVNEKYKKSHGREATAKGEDNELNKARKQYAKNYAINMVMSLHFDYNDFSKAKLIREPVGKVLFQFQHYSFKFFEKNWEFLRKGTNDLVSREMTGANAMNMYRLGLVYFAAPYLASMIIPVDWGNLIEHDAFNKLEKFGTFFWGDEDDQRKAFYGKGPIMGTIGAPVISDLLTLGHLYDFINLDEESLARILVGYQDYGNITGDQQTYQLMRTLNTSIGRQVYRTLPQLMKGNIYGLQSELGLYHTDKKAQKNLEKLAPDLFEVLDRIEAAGKAKKSKWR
jgi:hypothetical protein